MRSIQQIDGVDRLEMKITVRSSKCQSNLFTDTQSDETNLLENDTVVGSRGLPCHTKHSQSLLGGEIDSNWLLNSPKYESWLKSTESSILWLQGIPGSGKSTLASAIRADIASRNDDSVFVFYYQQEERSKDPAKSLLRNLLSQLHALEVPLEDRLRTDGASVSARQKHPSNKAFELRQLFDLVLSHISLKAQVYFIMDALDDVPWIVEALVSAITARDHNLTTARPFKVLVTYRSSSKSLVRCAEDSVASGTGIEVDLDNSSAAKKALTNYIEGEIVRLLFAKPENEVKIQKLTRLIEQRSAGCFVWVQFILEDLARRLNAGSKFDTLDFAPMNSNLDEIYQKRLDSAILEDGAQVIQILKWILYAVRPLKIEELDAALQIGSSLRSTDYHYSSSFRATLLGLNLEVAYSSICGGLVQVSKDQCLVLTHRTVREYLCYSDKRSYRRRVEFGYTQSHESLAMTCLENLIEHSRIQNSKYRQHSDLSHTESLHMYAQHHWAQHYRIAESQSQYLTETLYEYLSSAVEDKQQILGRQHRYNAHRSMLHFCATSGFTELCKVLLQMGTPVDSYFDSSGQTPLHLAVNLGHYEVVRLLLEYGADNEAKPLSGEMQRHLPAQNLSQLIAKLHRTNVKTWRDLMFILVLNPSGIHC
ncbi:MAG: hypothetical protein Q9190_004013 [Brigantiaea leucoxantha]